MHSSLQHCFILWAELTSSTDHGYNLQHDITNLFEFQSLTSLQLKILVTGLDLYNPLVTFKKNWVCVVILSLFMTALAETMPERMKYAAEKWRSLSAEEKKVYQ